MQFKVPQNVQREDKIVGPLTMKQLIICGIGFAIDYAIYTSLGRDYIWVTWILPVALVGIITIAFAFIRPLDLSFTKYIFRWLEFILVPRQRYWIRSSAEVYANIAANAGDKAKADAKLEAKAIEAMDKHRKLEEITRILNTQEKPTTLPKSDKLS